MSSLSAPFSTRGRSAHDPEMLSSDDDDDVRRLPQPAANDAAHRTTSPDPLDCLGVDVDADGGGDEGAGRLVKDSALAQRLHKRTVEPEPIEIPDEEGVVSDEIRSWADESYAKSLLPAAPLLRDRPPHRREQIPHGTVARAKLQFEPTLPPEAGPSAVTQSALLVDFNGLFQSK